jgi:hypothetical protein
VADSIEKAARRRLGEELQHNYFRRAEFLELSEPSKHSSQPQDQNQLEPGGLSGLRFEVRVRTEIHHEHRDQLQDDWWSERLRSDLQKVSIVEVFRKRK